MNEIRVGNTYSIGTGVGVPRMVSVMTHCRDIGPGRFCPMLGGVLIGATLEAPITDTGKVGATDKVVPNLHVE